MKKAKIMLMAIAIIAVVGGALAFKAKTFNLHVFYSCPGATGFCTVAVGILNTTTIAPFGFIQNVYYTKPVLTWPCPTTRLTAAP